MSKKMLTLFVAVMAMGAVAKAGYMEDVVRKLGRGVANIAGCPVEVLMNMQAVTEDNGLVAGVTYGTTRGVYHGVTRALVGAFEVVTFVVPTDVIIQPEFVMDPNSSEEYEWEL